MSREATKWAYNAKIAELRLTPPELSLLRALCWSADPQNGNKTKELSDAHLMRLTGYKTHAKIVEARKLLKKRELIKHLPEEETGASAKKTEYVYFVRFEPVRGKEAS